MQNDIKYKMIHNQAISSNVSNLTRIFSAGDVVEVVDHGARFWPRILLAVEVKLILDLIPYNDTGIEGALLISLKDVIGTDFGTHQVTRREEMSRYLMERERERERERKILCVQKREEFCHPKCQSFLFLDFGCSMV